MREGGRGSGRSAHQKRKKKGQKERGREREREATLTNFVNKMSVLRISMYSLELSDVMQLCKHKHVCLCHVPRTVPRTVPCAVCRMPCAVSCIRTFVNIICHLNVTFKNEL